MIGPARALRYRLAATTGLRYTELKSMPLKSFDFHAEHPTVRVQAGYTKDGQTAVLPEPLDLA